jgi:hypothetical protein
VVEVDQEVILLIMLEVVVLEVIELQLMDLHL